MADKSFTAVLRLGSTTSVADDSRDVRSTTNHMQLSDNLVAAIKSLSPKAWNRFQFFRLERIPFEDLIRASEEALREKRQKVDEEIRTTTEEIREARLHRRDGKVTSTLPE